MKPARWMMFACSLALACVSAHAGSTLDDRLGKFFNDTGEQPEFLDPDAAFILSADAAGRDRILLRWEIADGYYLYRDNFRFSVTGDDVVPGQPELPAGELKEDQEFGNVEVYHHAVEITLPVAHPGKEQLPIKLSVTYQGCKEDEICYPPVNKELALLLPAATNSTASTVTAGKVSSQDRISAGLRTGGMLANVVAFLGFGLLLAFTPCIFPIIPILSGIIAGRGAAITPSRAFVLTLIYVLAMALAYAVMGVMAGMFSLNLQAAAQNAWVIVAFSLIFVLLALSMFGFYDLQLPQSWQTRMTAVATHQQRGELGGAAVMGLLSAIIVGPCVAPPLAGALIYISQTGDAVLGGLALFALGLGMGLPLLVIGTSAGTLLPRAGAWMDTVKQIFGVIMLGVAIWLLSRLLPGPVTLFLWGVLLIVTALYMGVLNTLSPDAVWQKLWKGLGLVFLIYGAALIVGAASGSQDLWRPLHGIAGKSGKVDTLKFVPVESVADLDRLLVEAEWKNQPVLLEFYADWCITCKELERYTFSNPGVHAALENLVLLKADVTENDAMDQELLKRFGIFGPPAILFFIRGEERKNFRLVGFINADDFVRHVRQISAL